MLPTKFLLNFFLIIQTRRIYNLYKPEPKKEPVKAQKNKLSPKRIAGGIAFLVLFIITSLLNFYDLWNPHIKWLKIDILKTLSILEIMISFFFFFPEKNIGITTPVACSTDKKLTKRSLVAAFLILILIPITIYIGFSF